MQTWRVAPLRLGALLKWDGHDICHVVLLPSHGMTVLLNIAKYLKMVTGESQIDPGFVNKNGKGVSICFAEILLNCNVIDSGPSPSFPRASHRLANNINKMTTNVKILTSPSLFLSLSLLSLPKRYILIRCAYVCPLSVLVKAPKAQL